MPVPRSPTLALALLGACLAACFTDDGAPALSTAAATADASPGPTTADLSTSTTTATTEATSSDPATTDNPASTTEAPTTGCVPETWYFDIDKDGYGGPEGTEKCGSPGPGFTLDSLDCNDIDFNINPGAAEVCDTVDNDCDGGVDEYPAVDMAGECNGCTPFLGTGSTYYFCATPERDWDGARAHCNTLLGDLVVIGDAAERTDIYNLLPDPALRWWVGLGDPVNEGTYVWVDGSALDPDIPTWGTGEPDNIDGNFAGPANCIDLALKLGGWRDQSCSDPHSFICEAPLPI
jgi:hypothetical protein